MSDWKNEAEAREQIKALVSEYYHDFKEKKEPFKPGDRISYASRVFDEKEMQSLTDAMLDFWLTTGRFSDEFEKKFAEWIGVRFVHLEQRLVCKPYRVFGVDCSRTRGAADQARR